MMYVLPAVTQTVQQLNQDITWEQGIDVECVCAYVLKTGMDAVAVGGWKWTKVWNPLTPLTDTAVNVLWQVPTVASYYYSRTTGDEDKRRKTKPNDVLTLVGGTAFDFSGWLSPVLYKVANPVPSPTATGVVCILISLGNMIWGTSCILQSWGPLKRLPRENSE